MKVTPVASPAQIKSTATPEHVRTARAVEAFNKGVNSQSAQQTPPAQPQTVPVNQNAIAVEELGAIQPQVPQPAVTIEDTVTPEATAPKPPEQDPALQRQFAQLARQERALRAKVQQQEQAIKAREDAVKAREAELTAKDNTYRTDYIPKARLKQDALGVLEAEGIATYDDMTQRALTRQPIDPILLNTIDALKAQVEELKAANETSQKSYQEQQSANYQAAVKQITRDAKDLVANDPEFEAIRATNSVRDVVELIEKWHAKTGEVLSVEEAAQKVEAEIVEQASKLTRIEKIRQRMNQSNASTGKSTQQQQAKPQQQTQMKTLTNATGSTRQLSAKERAILAFKGELKS